MTFYPLAPDSFGDEEHAALLEVVNSGMVTMGTRVSQFEAAFAEYHDVPHAIMVNSGSSANLIAVGSFFYRSDRPLQRGDEAIVPAIAWSTTYAPLQQYGLKLRIVDVDLETLNMDVEQLEAAVTPNTRLLVGVSILGNPADLQSMRGFAAGRGLHFLEDNCESLGAAIDDRLTGTFGDIGTSSFFFSHQLTTYEGGMLITGDRETADLARALRAHGWTRDLGPDSPIFEPREDSFAEAYRFLLPGYNVRPTEFAGALGIVQLRKLDRLIEQRRKNLALLGELFRDDERFLLPLEHGRSSSFCFPIVLNPSLDVPRQKVLDALAAADIQYRMITGGCFTRHDAATHYEYETVGGLNNAQTVHERGFFVGNGPLDLSEQLHRLRGVLDAACK